MKKIIEFAHQLIEEKITKEDVVLDLTVGNGNDTLFLCKIAKFVYGFDIQKEACEHTKIRLNNLYNNYEIINDSHLNFRNYVSHPFKAAIFNLGYLPKGSKNITTSAKVTLLTLKLILEDMETGGICVIVVYPGHQEGMNESIALSEYLKGLDQHSYDVIKYEFFNQINYPPYLFAIKKSI